MAPHADLSTYYMLQARGIEEGGIYKTGRIQKGEGLGSFLGALFRRVVPLFTSGAKVVGKQALSTGVEILKDALQGRAIKESVRERVTQAGTNLSEKAANKLQSMVGNGIRKRKRRTKVQSGPRRKRRKVSRPKKRKVTKRRRKTKKGRVTKRRSKQRDIFS